MVCVCCLSGCLLLKNLVGSTVWVSVYGGGKEAIYRRERGTMGCDCRAMAENKRVVNGRWMRKDSLDH
jgi:hypothetical protein